MAWTTVTVADAGEVATEAGDTPEAVMGIESGYATASLGAVLDDTTTRLVDPLSDPLTSAPEAVAGGMMATLLSSSFLWSVLLSIACREGSWSSSRAAFRRLVVSRDWESPLPWKDGKEDDKEDDDVLRLLPEVEVCGGGEVEEEWR